jgi:hypothetical protein
MAELNIGALTDSKTYTGSVGTTNIYDLYKFNITSPGSFKFAIDGLSGNADVFLLNNSGATLYSSTNAGNAAETISADSLVAGDYTLKVLQITGDIKYTLNLAPTSTQKSSDADTITGSKSDTLSTSSSTIAEKATATANKDVITGDTVAGKTVTAEVKPATSASDKPVTTSSETSSKSEPEKPVIATESAIAKSTTTEKPVTTSSETTTKSESEKPVTATESAIAKSTTTEKPVTTSSETTTKSESEKPVTGTESAIAKSTTTDKPVTTTSETSSKSESEKPVTGTESAIAKSTTTDKPVTTSSETSSKSETEKPVTGTESAIAKSTTTEKPVTTSSETSIKSETEKPVTATESAIAKSTTTEKPVTTTSETSIKSETEKPVTGTESAIAKSTTTEKPVTTSSETTTKSESEKPVTATESAIAKSTTTDKPVTTTSETSIKSEPEKPVIATESAIATSATTEKPVNTSSETTTKSESEKTVTAGETVATKEPKTGETVAAVTDASKPADKPSTATSNGEDKKTENANTSIPTAETTTKIDPPTNKELTAANPFTSGTFVVDSTGKVGIDYLLDGGLYRGQLAIISLKGMEKFVPGSTEFIKEATSRALSNSEKGHIVIDDLSEGARFSGNLPEGNYNEGAYLGVKTFAMTPGDEFGIMIVPNDTFKFLSDYPTFGGDKRPLFSMVTANPNEAFHLGQIADITGEGNSFAMEDMRFDAGSDKDYNDITFQVRGAKGKAPLMDSLVNPDKDWRKTDLGKAVIAYAKPYITPEPQPKLEGKVSGLIDDLEKEITNPSTPGKETPKASEPKLGTDKTTTEPSKVVPTDKVEATPAIPAVKTEEKVEDTAVDSTEKSPIEKTPVPTATEQKDKVAETPAATTLPAKSTTETETVVLPVESKTETEVAKPTTTEVAKAETPKVAVPGKSVEILGTKLPVEKTPVFTAASEEKDKVVETSPATTLPAKSTAETEKIANITPKVEAKSEVLPATSKTETEVAKPAITEVAKADTPKVGLPGNSVDFAVKENLPIPIQPQETTEVKPELPVAIAAPAKEEVAQNNNDVNADWIARLESLKQRLSNLGNPDVVGENAIDRTLIARLETMTEKLREQTRSTAVSDNTGALISRLEDMVVQVAPKPVETVQFEFPKVAQPLVGIFNENGFTQGNPKIDYSRITLAKDRVENDANPLVFVGEGNNPDSAALAIIEQINKNAPLVVGRAPASSEEWAKSLIEYVDTAQASGQPNAIVSLNLNLTQVKKDGSITPRYELTKAEKDALAYAQKYNVLVVVPAGDDRETMSALGEISLEFDNIMTVGAAKRVNDSVAASKAYDLANTSGSGYALDILADGSSGETFNTAVAANKVAGAASQVWAANPKLSYRQVVDIIQRTATDLNTPNWDFETGSGLLNIPAAVNLAKVTPAIDTDVAIRWLDVDKKNQPLIGIIDTGFNGKNPDIDYKRIILGRDRVDNDNDPLLGGEGSEHGTHVLGIIGATQGNGIGIDGINDDAPIWLGRAIGSGKWAESLREFVDAAKASGQPKAVVNLSFDLTQTNPDGSVTTRYELTPQERQAIEYARQNGVMIVVAAGNNGATMSALGQASQEFDNIITVGSINYNGDRADYSSFGYGLDFVARGGTPNEQVLSTIGEGVNLKQMIGDEEPPEDEMSANARTTFEEVFGAFSDGKESENDEKELETLTPEERQVYDEATKEIDQLLKDYLGAASEKIALEYVDGYYGASVDALSKFVDAFDEDLADNLIKAQEILEEAGFKTDTPTETNLDFSIPLDLGIGEMAGTSVAAAKVTGAVSQVWAANPGLSYFQVKEILKQTAVDLNKPGWDLETGSGLVNIAAAVELAKRIQPQAYQPKPIQSPLTWSGEGKVTPGERAVAVSVPTFTGRLMNAGYVTQTGWLRIRSGPGTNFAEVGRKYPGDATNFDAYENNGAWVPDPSMPGGGSSRWYKIAGTNNWMSALYIDNTPERADQERQQQDAIRRAEEEQRRAEDAIRRAEEDARRAEDELRRLEAEQRRAQEEARRRAEEEARRRIEEELRRILEEERRKQEQFQALVNEVSQKYGELGGVLGSYISNGVTVHQFDNGTLFVQPDGSHYFYKEGQIYEAEKKKFQDLKKIANAKKIDDFINKKIVDPKGFFNTLDALNPAAKWLSPELVLDGATGIREFFVNGQGKFLLKVTDFLKPVGEFLDDDLIKVGGKSALKKAGALDLAFTVGDIAFAETEEKKRRAQIKAGAALLAGGIGAVAGGVFGVGAGAIPGGFGAAVTTTMIMDGIYAGADFLGLGDDLDNAIGNSYSAISSFTNSALEAAKEKAKAAADKAKELAEKAKAAYQTATATVQQAKAAYQTFKTEVQKATTQIVQQSQQKLKEEAQKILNKVVQNPVVQQGSKVVKQVAKYAQKAVQAVNNVINTGKQIINNVIDTGKQIINNVIDTGKKAYQEVKNFVVNTYETGNTNSL